MAEFIVACNAKKLHYREVVETTERAIKECMVEQQKIRGEIVENTLESKTQSQTQIQSEIQYVEVEPLKLPDRTTAKLTKEDDAILVRLTDTLAEQIQSDFILRIQFFNCALCYSEIFIKKNHPKLFAPYNHAPEQILADYIRSTCASNYHSLDGIEELNRLMSKRDSLLQKCTALRSQLSERKIHLAYKSRTVNLRSIDVESLSLLNYSRYSYLQPSEELVLACKNIEMIQHAHNNTEYLNQFHVYGIKQYEEISEKIHSVVQSEIKAIQPIKK